MIYDLIYDHPLLPKQDLGRDLQDTHSLRQKVRASDSYAQNLYAALCNNEFQKIDVMCILRDQRWTCSWRSSGAIIAAMRGEGDYMDWYCSGRLGMPDNHGHTPRHFVDEGLVTDEIKKDLENLGWNVISDH